MLLFIPPLIPISQKLKTKYKFRDNDLSDSKDFVKQGLFKKRLENLRKNSHFKKTSAILNNDNLPS